MQRSKIDRKPSQRIVSLAYYMSSHNPNIWYVCQCLGKSEVLVSDQDINRFLQMGYQVSGAFLNGKHYKNIYSLKGELHFVK